MRAEPPLRQPNPARERARPHDRHARRPAVESPARIPARQGQVLGREPHARAVGDGGPAADPGVSRADGGGAEERPRDDGHAPGRAPRVHAGD